MLFSTPKEHLFNVITPVTYLELLCLLKEEGRRMFLNSLWCRLQNNLSSSTALFFTIQTAYLQHCKLYIHFRTNIMALSAKLPHFPKYFHLYNVRDVRNTSDFHPNCTARLSGNQICLMEPLQNRLILCIRYISHQWYCIHHWCCREWTYHEWEDLKNLGVVTGGVGGEVSCCKQDPKCRRKLLIYLFKEWMVIKSKTGDFYQSLKQNRSRQQAWTWQRYHLDNLNETMTKQRQREKRTTTNRHDT